MESRDWLLQGLAGLLSAHCYAEGVAKRFWATQYPWIRRQMPGTEGRLYESPRGFTDVQCHEDRLEQPLHWRKPRRVFVNSMSDLFHEDVPDNFIDRVFAVMRRCPDHVFQCLTKRPKRMLAYMVPEPGREPRWCNVNDACAEMFGESSRGLYARGWPLPNVWLGVSVESQATADERIPLLLQTPAAVRFLSCEPLLEEVVVFSLDGPIDVIPDQPSPLDWVILGGESGPKARPCDVAWIRSILGQCQQVGVPCFVKQLGSRPMAMSPSRVNEWPDNVHFKRHDPEGCAHLWDPVLVDRKGGDQLEWPEDLRVREFPSGG